MRQREKSELTTALRDPGCRIEFSLHAFSGGVISFRDMTAFSGPCRALVSLPFPPSFLLLNPSLFSDTDMWLFKLGAEKDLSGHVSPPLLRWEESEGRPVLLSTEVDGILPVSLLATA